MSMFLLKISINLFALFIFIVFLLKFGEQPILSHRNNFSALNLMEK